MKIETNLGMSYSFQLFAKLKNHMICLGTSVSKLDEKLPFDSAVKDYKFINDLINVLLKSLEEI